MEINKSLVAVVIPIYKTTITKNELLSLKQVAHVLSNYPIIFIAPIGLNHDIYKRNLPEGEFLFFDPEFFLSIDGYNRLMLSHQFYFTFLKYKYILIYQLDAFVFKDELKDWCSKGFDYIGAPWGDNEHISFIESLGKSSNPLFWIINKFRSKRESYAGNGGFSLRRTFTHYLNCLLFKYYILSWPANEDLFWGIFVPQFNFLFKVANNEIASAFAVEKNNLNKDDLPFGCHAWEKFNPQFIDAYTRSYLIDRDFIQ